MEVVSSSHGDRGATRDEVYKKQRHFKSGSSLQHYLEVRFPLEYIDNPHITLQKVQKLESNILKRIERI